jgi:hypothetical protein
MIDTKRNKLYDKATLTVIDAMMLLLLHRLLRDAVIFCVFEKKWDLMTENKRFLEQDLVYERKEEEVLTDSSYTEGLLYCVL